MENKIMTMTEADFRAALSRAIDEGRRQQLAETHSSSEPVICREWLKLRTEINKYCFDNMQPGFRHSTIQQSIYAPIKYVLGLHRIDYMTDEQAIQARDIFNFIKGERDYRLRYCRTH